MNRFLALLLFPVIAFGAPWDGILAPERAIDWSTVGIPGGIPVRNTICANLTAGASTATIQAAMDACPPGQVVSFGAGTFDLTSSIHARKGITLRGQGPTQTRINVTGANILFGSGTGGQGSPMFSAYQTRWTGGLTRGSTVLTVASTSNLRAGQTIIIDERNPAWVFPDTTARSCTTGNSCGRNDSPPGFSGSASRAQGQMTKIVSVDSATQITIKDPVSYTHSINVGGADPTSPQVFSWNDGSIYGNTEYAGIENLTVNANGTNLVISFPWCDYCWVKNVAVLNPGRSAVLYYYSYGGVVRDSYMSTTNTNPGSTQYGFELIMSANVLIENNIGNNITAAIMPEATYNLVLGYNYFLNTVPGNMFADVEPHLAHNSFQLYEGNNVGTILYDTWWGSSSHNTSFRNRVKGTNPNKLNYRSAMKLYAYQRFTNIVANVLGTPGVQSRYSCDDINVYNTTDGNVYEVGGLNGCGSPGETQDSVTRTSLLRWGNWDSVTYAANGNTNGIRYCTGSGAGNSSCTASETGSSDPTFPGLASPSTSFPPSFYLSGVGVHASCGTGISFWKNPTLGTCPPFPPIGPDVTCSGANCETTVGSHASKIPAQICYDQTPKDANGFLTTGSGTSTASTFDAATCYSPDTGIKPTPPTGVVVH